MALTIGQLAYSLRITADPGDAVDAGTTAELTRMQAVAMAYISAEVGTRAPEVVQDEAVRLLAGYLYDGPDFNPGGAAVNYIDAWRQSGAQSLLSRWRQHRAGLIGPPVGGAAGGVVVPSGGAGGGLDQSAVDARVLALVAAWALAGQARPSGGAGGGLDQSAVDARIAAAVAAWALTGEDQPSYLTAANVETLIAGNAAIREAAEFEAALRTESAIVTSASVQVAIAEAAYRLPGVPKVPAAEGDRELVARVGAGLHFRWDVVELTAKPAASQGTTLSAANALSWTEGDVTYYLGRESNGTLLFSASDIDTYVVTLSDSRIDLQPEVRRSAAQTIVQLIRSTVAAAVQGDIAMAVNGAALEATLKQANVDPADLRFDAGTLVAGRVVGINEAASGFAGLDPASVGGAHGIMQVFDGSPAGMFITARNLLTPNPSVLDDTIDIDATGWQEGEWHFSLRATISNRASSTAQSSANTISFTAGDGTDTERDVSGLVFTSTLRAQDTWVAGGSTEGEEIMRLPMHYIQFLPSQINRDVGTLSVYLVTQVVSGAKRVRFVPRYDPASAVNFTFNISFTLKVSLFRSDPGSATSDVPSGVPIPSGIATGQLIRKSATGWEAIPDRVPIPSGIATGQLIRKSATGWEAVGFPSVSAVSKRGIQIAYISLTRSGAAWAVPDNGSYPAGFAVSGSVLTSNFIGDFGIIVGSHGASIGTGTFDFSQYLGGATSGTRLFRIELEFDTTGNRVKYTLSRTGGTSRSTSTTRLRVYRWLTP